MRGNNALGPELIERIARLQFNDVEYQNDMQLQVEHVTDLAACKQVLFIVADMSCAEPFDFSEISAVKDDSYTSHAMNPTALLHAYRQVYEKDAPPAFLLRIRGYDFSWVMHGVIELQPIWMRQPDQLLNYAGLPTGAKLAATY